MNTRSVVIMGFWNYLFRAKKDYYAAGGLFAAFYVFYVVMNLPFMSYMKENQALLAEHNPFYGVPFALNLFNFDPSMQYGPGNASVIHPLISFLTGPFGFLSKHLFDNLFFLALQAAVNALSVVLVYCYLKRSAEGAIIPFLMAAFFGISSYSLFTALVPDSYPYAQLFLILSVVYLQYSREQAKTKVLPHAGLALANFGITSTNIVPFMASLFANNVMLREKGWIWRLVRIVAAFLLLVILATGLQWLLFDGHSWIHNWSKTLDNGGYNYVAPFSFFYHWKAIYMLGISPILTPDAALVTPSIVAFATDLLQPYPIHVSVVGMALLLLAAAGFIRLIKTREAWILGSYIGAAIGLHIVVGYGLAAFQNDLYLYAGHYLFAIFLLAGRFAMEIKRDALRKGLTVILGIFLLAALVHNVVQHAEVLQVIESSFANGISN
ncbi:DUF6080 domain-containing protein [Paenibacillus soyae]|uniref:DUF6080 domain-containing protein n=1 Tax=Paenibacillus soyae TaxID=2969249 RepID=A0A9X2S9W5_9BACL|nr:DUF6080 domain-containing protein [Paenibacillus soyae]MCR2805894.1 DUF6080 domain-containing protein [Paenibacillus soyae]